MNNTLIISSKASKQTSKHAENELSNGTFVCTQYDELVCGHSNKQRLAVFVFFFSSICIMRTNQQQHHYYHDQPLKKNKQAPIVNNIHMHARKQINQNEKSKLY